MNIRKFLYGVRSFVKVAFFVVVFTTSIISITFYIPGSPYIRCVQCSSDGALECVNNPPRAMSCFRKERFCQIVTKTSINGTLVSVTRNCASDLTSNSCITEEDLQICTITCNEPGCNLAPSNCSSCLYFVFLLFLLAINLT